MRKGALFVVGRHRRHSLDRAGLAQGGANDTLGIFQRTTPTSDQNTIPYDTSARLEPQLWPLNDDPGRYGRVDFDAGVASRSSTCTSVVPRFAALVRRSRLVAVRA